MSNLRFRKTNITQQVCILLEVEESSEELVSQMATKNVTRCKLEATSNVLHSFVSTLIGRLLLVRVFVIACFNCPNTVHTCDAPSELGRFISSNVSLWKK